MENKTSFVQHVKGCGYAIKNDESLNERLKDIQR
jgi:hypothetical protein